MARFLHVYPKVELAGSTWTFLINVYEHATRITTRFIHTLPAGLTANLRELKVSFDVTVADSDTDLDVDDALFVDDIKPGQQIQTVISNWVGRAETLIAGLSDPTLSEYWAAWSKQDTSKTRGDVKKALVDQRGWTITSVHQHEGDGTNTDSV